MLYEKGLKTQAKRNTGITKKQKSQIGKSEEIHIIYVLYARF